MAAPHPRLREPASSSADRPESLGGPTSLARLRPGAVGIVESLAPDDEVTQRLRDLGIVPGTRIAVLRAAPLGDPILYELRGYDLSLRRSEAERVRVLPAVGTRNRAS